MSSQHDDLFQNDQQHFFFFFSGSCPVCLLILMAFDFWNFFLLLTSLVLCLRLPVPPNSRFYLFMFSSWMSAACSASLLKPSTTLTEVLAEVSKNIMSPFSLQNFSASSVGTHRLSCSAKSTLFPNTKNGSLVGSSG